MSYGKNRLNYKITYALEDIIAHGLSAEEELEIAAKRADYFFDPITLVLVRRALGHVKALQEIAREARQAGNKKSPSAQTGSSDN